MNTHVSRTPRGERVSFAVVDNHDYVLRSITGAMPAHPDLDLRGCHHDVAELDLTGPPPDVVVLDLYLGRDDTPSTGSIPDLTAWGARVLLHTSAEFPVPVRQAVAAGALGLSLKNDGLEAMLDAVRVVATGEFACSSTVAGALLTDDDLIAELTARELEVIQAIDDGLTHREIARRHNIAESTVKDHLKSVRAKYVKLGRDISNAHSIVREARRDGWISGR
jgi:DNA-binding NarL/FixJ family response regulator